MSIRYVGWSIIAAASLLSGTVLGQTAEQAANGKSDLPFITSLPDTVCAGEKYYDAAGVKQTGTRNCTVNAECQNNGQVGCVTTATYKSGDLGAAVPANIKAGATVAGATGNMLLRPADCAVDGQSECMANPNYRAAKSTNFSNGDIKRGVSIAGISGVFPSTSSPLPRYVDESTSPTSGSNETDLVDVSTQFVVDGTFEYWDSTGRRRTGSGDSDIVIANIKSGIVLENLALTGTNVGVSPPNHWDVRVGVNRGDGQTGELRVNCRNSINSAIYNYDGVVASITDSTVTTGTVYDVFDTIDDGLGQPPATGFPSAWNANTNYCGGIAASPTDANVWLDVTVAGGSCNGTVCRFKDKITGLEWSKTVGSSRTWPQAVADCETLTLDGFSDWRLPTQKEAMTAYANGIRSAANTNWISSTTMGGLLATASSTVATTANPWAEYLAMGGSQSNVAKSAASFAVACVR